MGLREGEGRGGLLCVEVREGVVDEGMGLGYKVIVCEDGVMLKG